MTTTTANGNLYVYIGAASPMFQYAPTRNGPIGSSWLQTSDGQVICAGPATFAVQLDGLYFSQIDFIYSTTGPWQVSTGIDGTLRKAGSGGSSLSPGMGSHTVRLETMCQGCSTGQTFGLVGVRLITAGQGANATLDDASSVITYSGWTTSNAQSTNMQGTSQGQYYGDTLSYTSSAGASLSFAFTGSSIYIFGPTGPASGVFSITLDGTPQGSFNSSTTLPTSNVLLYWKGGLSDTSHNLVLTNEVESGTIAVDYVVATSASNGVGTGTGTGGVGGGGGGVVTGTENGAGVFPGQTDTGRGKDGAAGLAIGLTLGILAFIFLLWTWWRWRSWKKAGGTGNFLVALCGARDRPKPPAPKPPGKFPLWPMLSYKPKYAT